MVLHVLTVTVRRPTDLTRSSTGRHGGSVETYLSFFDAEFDDCGSVASEILRSVRRGAPQGWIGYFLECFGLDDREPPRRHGLVTRTISGHGDWTLLEEKDCTRRFLVDRLDTREDTSGALR